MKLHKLIEVLQKAATVCDQYGENCDVDFIVDDDELELHELVGTGEATVPVNRGELSPFPGWQERLTFRFRVKGATYNEGT